MGRPKGSKNRQPDKHERGRVYYANGYAIVYDPTCPYASKKGSVRRNKWVLWKAGVEIPKGSHVHHRDEDRGNDSLDNLEVLTKAEHYRQHATGHVVTEESRKKIAESLSRFYESPEAKQRLREVIQVRERDWHGRLV